MSPVPFAACCCGFLSFDGAIGAAGVTSPALRSGQETPRSGIGSKGALGSSSPGTEGAGGGGAGALCAAANPGASADTATAHSSRAAHRVDPRPLIKQQALDSGPEPRQYVGA